MLSLMQEKEENPEQLCLRLIGHYSAKADHNKSETLVCFYLVIICTLITPLFITLGPGLWLGKVIPSVLSLIAAGATTWLQQRKPQQLWSLYRTAQRELEVQIIKYRYRVDEYQDAADPNKILASKAAAVVLGTHQQWIPVVPSPDQLKLTERKDEPPNSQLHKSEPTIR